MHSRTAAWEVNRQGTHFRRSYLSTPKPACAKKRLLTAVSWTMRGHVGPQQAQGATPRCALNWWGTDTKDKGNKLDGTSWHERSVLCSRGWTIQMLWLTHRIPESAHVHSEFLETILMEVTAKHHCSVTHISISLSLQVLDLVVTIDFLDFLQSPAFLATSSGWAKLPERSSSAGLTYSPSPSAPAKKRTDCHACPGATSGMPGGAAQAVVTSAHAVPVVASQQWCTIRASQTSVILCTPVTKTISE